jgi:heme A synthase
MRSTTKRLVRHVNRHSFLLLGAVTLLIVAGALTLWRPTPLAPAAVVAAGLALWLVHRFARPTTRPIQRHEVPRLIGSGRPTLVEVYSDL